VWFLSIVKLLFLAVLCLVIFYHSFMSANYIKFVLQVSDFDNKFIQEITQTASVNGRVFLNADSENNPPLELFMGTGWHLKYLRDRSDIVYGYLPRGYFPQERDLILNHTASLYLSKEEIEESNLFEIIASETLDTSSIILAGPVGIIKETIKLFLTLSKDQDQKTDYHFFAASARNYTWEIYRAKNGI